MVFEQSLTTLLLVVYLVFAAIDLLLLPVLLVYMRVICQLNEMANETLETNPTNLFET